MPCSLHQPKSCSLGSSLELHSMHCDSGTLCSSHQSAISVLFAPTIDENCGSDQPERCPHQATAAKAATTPTDCTTVRNGCRPRGCSKPGSGRAAGESMLGGGTSVFRGRWEKLVWLMLKNSGRSAPFSPAGNAGRLGTGRVLAATIGTRA